MNEARRLQYLQVENSEEAALLVTSFKKFRSQSIKVGSSYYKLVLSQAGLSGLVDIWFPSCFGLVGLIAIISGLLFGAAFGLGLAFAYGVFHLLLYPNWQKAKRRILVSKHLPLFLESLEQASSAGRSISDSIDASIDALPFGVLKSELKQLRSQGESENCLKIVEKISGREIKCLAGGLSILLGFGRPSLWQVSELKSRVTSMCHKMEEKGKRYLVLMRLTQVCALIGLVCWVLAVANENPLPWLDIIILGQLVTLIFVGNLAEQVLPE